MTKQTNQAVNVGKKAYAKPQMQVYEVKSANIIATSSSSTQQLEEETFQWSR